MRKSKKFETFIKNLSIVYGIVLTFFMIIVFVPKIIGKIIEDGISYLIEIPESFVSWDNPTPFFFYIYHWLCYYLVEAFLGFDNNYFRECVLCDNQRYGQAINICLTGVSAGDSLFALLLFSKKK
jgi:hypothetical protein